MAQRIQIRRDTAANWTSVNPILSQGEMGYETNTKLLKFGDGSTAWNSLSYFIGNAAVTSWDFSDNANAFPTADAIRKIYITLDDHGVLGDADYVSANSLM